MRPRARARRSWDSCTTGLRAAFGARKRRPGPPGSRRAERLGAVSPAPPFPSRAGPADRWRRPRAAWTRVFSAWRKLNLTWQRRRGGSLARGSWLPVRARGRQGHNATATGEGSQRGTASGAPVRRPSTPVKKPGNAPPAHSQQGKRKWDQDWSNGQGAQNAKWAKSRR